MSQENTINIKQQLEGSTDYHLVAGLRLIEANNDMDFITERLNGMKGYLLNLTTKGQGEVFDGQETHFCYPGDLLLFPSYKSFSYKRSNYNDCWHYRWLYFYPRTHWVKWLKWSQNKNSIGFLRLGTESPQLNEFDRLLESIELTQHSGKQFSEELSMNLLERLLLRCLEIDPTNPNQILDHRVLQACQYISSNLALPLTIDDIAHHVCLSASRLTYLFREQVGMNILRWREEKRVMRAKLLLQMTNYSIGNTGRQLGYDDQLYFSRIFRKQVGMSPSEYRQQYQQFHFPELEHARLENQELVV